MLAASGVLWLMLVASPRPRGPEDGDRANTAPAAPQAGIDASRPRPDPPATPRSPRAPTTGAAPALESELAALGIGEVEATRFRQWAEGRCAQVRARFDPEEARDGRTARSFTHPVADDDTLRLWAQAGDRLAMATLGLRLLDAASAGPAREAQRAEARRWLEASWVRGCTVGMSELSHDALNAAYRQAKRDAADAGPPDRAGLVEAYALLLLRQRRGELDAGWALEQFSDTLRALGRFTPLTEGEGAQARAAAEARLAAMAEQRQALGLPPFDDALPADLAPTWARIEAHLQALTDALRARADAAAAAASSGAPR